MKIGIIGGGASGIVAAIEAAQKGADVTILEKNDRIGKKILATGNGKCNLTNLDFSYAYYHSKTPEKLEAVFTQFNVEDTLDYFHELGLMTRDRQGYVYPFCEQAAVVLDLLRIRLEQLNVTIITDCIVTNIKENKSGNLNGYLIEVKKDSKKISKSFDRIILACGSPAGTKNPDEYNGLAIAKDIQLKTIPFLPALVQLRCREKFMKALAGVRCQGEIICKDIGLENKEAGEIQLTEYGISGIPVFQISRNIVKQLQHKKEIPVYIDFLPNISQKDLKEQLYKRIHRFQKQTVEQFMTGTIHKKIIPVLFRENGLSSGVFVCDVPEQKLIDIVLQLKQFPLTVYASNPVMQAQVCSGGIVLDEIDCNMQSKKHKGLFITGEMLDVDGRCGGYNLQWAWTTGIIAGRIAAGENE